MALIYSKQLIKTLVPITPGYHLDDARFRLGVMLGGILLVLVLLVTKLVELNQAGGHKARFLVEEKSINFRPDLVDKNGVLLATNLATTSVYAQPLQMIDVKEAAGKLAKVLKDTSAAELEAKFSSGRKFIYLKRNITPKEQQAINNLGLPGINFEDTTRRIYPQGNMFSHLVGYVDLDHKGLAGFERYLDSASELLNRKEPIKLSVDTRVQHILQQELAAGMNEYNTLNAAGLVMDVTTGEIISMVSLPDFDPHFPGKSKREALFNQVTHACYEPGSAFKTITMAMALEHKFPMSRNISTDEPIKVAKFQLRDYRGSRRYTNATAAEVFIRSSNIGTAKIAGEIGSEAQQEFIKHLNLHKPLDIELLERATPNFPEPKRWGALSTFTISYGHGFAMSPLHLAKAVGEIVNGGHELKPTLLAKEHNAQQENKGDTIVKPETAEQIRRLMRLVVEQGTAKAANVPGYNVGAKTGTSIKVVNGSYDRKKNITTFVGAFPINDPKYMVMIVLDEPHYKNTSINLTAGASSAPIAGKVIKRIAPILGVKPQSDLDFRDYDPRWFSKGLDDHI